MKIRTPLASLTAPCAAAIALLLGGCSSPGNDGAEAVPTAITGQELGTKNFLQFLNRQPALAAGPHTLVAATATAGASGSYRLRVTLDDGSVQSFDGAWLASGGPDAAAAGNPRHVIRLDVPGGLQATLESTAADAVLILLDAGGSEMARDDNSGGGSNARLVMAESKTDEAAYARAYYATIDPLQRRTTLTAWMQANGFDAGEDAHVVFRDTKDLGYGRNMHFRRNAAGTFAAYVGNYQITDIPGQAYGPLTLDAAIGEIDRYHIGTNAIEYGPVDSNGDGAPDDVTGDNLVDANDYFPRYYTFSPRPPFERLEAVDMDGNGVKGMPIPCITCHGGRADPLLPDGRFPRSGDTKGRVQPIDVDTLVLSDQAGFNRRDLEAGFKAINQAAYDSYAPKLAVQPGEWNSAMARELIEGWYGGPGLPSATFNDTYIPAGWRPDPADGFPPVGSDDLYRELLADNCRTCHILRGTADNSEIDFTSYEKFIGHVGEIVPLVYDQGKMPLALVPYFNLFDAPGLLDRLASFLPAFNRTNPDGTALRPGRPIANAGPDRTSPSPVAVNGIASRQAQSYQWRIVSQPAGAAASLDRADAVRPLLSADRNGVYVLELTVTLAGQRSAPDTVSVTIDAGMARPPQSLRFETDIKPLLQGGATNCVQCHAAVNGNNVLPPVFYTEPAAGENRDLYAEVRSRVNFNDPTESPLLTKPSGRHHNGGVVAGFDLRADRRNYDLFQAWILEGAPR